jgi:filamentous hemagglutinin
VKSLLINLCAFLLHSSKITVDSIVATKILDIRVQPGGLADSSKLIEYGKQRNITVIIKEFGG